MSVVAFGSGTAVAQLVLVVAAPMSTCLYSPTDFGLFAVFQASIAILLVVSSLRYELAIPLARSSHSAVALLGLSVLLNALVSVLCAIVVVSGYKWIAQSAETPLLAEAALLLPLALFGGGTFKALSYWAIRRSDFGLLGRTKISQNISLVGVQLACGLFGWGGFGLIIGQFLGYCVGTIRIARFAYSELIQGARRRGRARYLIVARKYRRFPIIDAPAALIDVVSVQIPNFLLALLFGPAVAGLYLLVDRVINVPLGLVSQVFGQVLYSRSMEELSRGHLYRHATRVLLVLVAILAPTVLLVYLVSDSAFSLLFGAEWGAAGAYAAWLAPGFGMTCTYSAFSFLLLTTNGQHVNLIIHIAMLGMKIAAISSGYLIGDASFSIAAFSLVNFFGYLIALLIVLRRVRCTMVLKVATQTELKSD